MTSLNPKLIDIFCFFIVAAETLPPGFFFFLILQRYIFISPRILCHVLFNLIKLLLADIIMKPDFYSRQRWQVALAQFISVPKCLLIYCCEKYESVYH